MIDEFFINVSNLPNKLTDQEINDLFVKYKSGDEYSRELIIMHNIRLVIYEVCKKFKLIEYDKRDLISAGNIGLIKAVDTFDISRHIKFQTYAVKCIDNEILLFLRKIKKHQIIDTIDKQIDENSDITLKDLLSDDVDLVREYEEKEDYYILNYIISNLPENERKIIMLYFGFYNGREFSQYEIANIIGCTQPTVSRAISKILKKLAITLKEQDIMEIKNNQQENKIKKI